MNGSAGRVVRKVTQSETFHDDALTGERSIAMELHTHDPVAEFTIVRRCLQKRILFRSGLPKGHGVRRLCPQQFKICRNVEKVNQPRCEGFGRNETLIGSDDPS